MNPLKVMCNDIYSNKSWGIVVQCKFNLCKINCGAQNVQLPGMGLNINTKTLQLFEAIVKKDFNRSRPYHTYILSMFSKHVDLSEVTQSFTSSASLMLMFGNIPLKESLRRLLWCPSQCSNNCTNCTFLFLPLGTASAPHYP